MSFLIRIKAALGLFILFAGLATPSHADTLNFLEWETAGVPLYWTGETELSLSNATVTSAGTDLYYSGAGGFLEKNNLGTVGACNSSGHCIGDLEITFTQPIFNLSFHAAVWNPGDVVTLKAYNGATKVAEVTYQDIHDILGFTVDFSSAGTITRLLFDDMDSTGSGVLYNDFLFDTAAVSTVPLPAALPLYAAGIAVLGFMGWRRRRA